MPERCPLREGGHIIGKLPDICRTNCEDFWVKAVEQGKISGPYDTYEHQGGPLYEDGEEEEECGHNGDLENSHSALHNTGGSAREYVLVDACGDCGQEHGEQGYKFECPFGS